MMALMRERGVSMYTLTKKDKVIGTATYYSIVNGTGGLDYRSLNRLCEYFKVQPGDLLSYEPDNEENT